MLLSDRDIRAETGFGLVIEPLEDHQFQPASVDLRLGDELRDDLGVWRIPDCGFSFKPGAFKIPCFHCGHDLYGHTPTADPDVMNCPGCYGGKCSRRRK